MPANIEGMVNQYSKIAQKTFNLHLDPYENKNKIVTIPLGFTFVPKIIFLKGDYGYSKSYFVKITGVGQNVEMHYGAGDNYIFKVIEITKENLKIQPTRVTIDGYYSDFDEIVAIG